MGDRNESVFGKLSHDVEVRPHVQLAPDQHHFGTGTEFLRLPLPLCINRQIHLSAQGNYESSIGLNEDN